MPTNNFESTPLEKRQSLEQKRSAPSTSKLPGTTIALMLCTTIALDVAEFLLDLVAIGFVLNIIIDFCVELGFYIWFKTRGMNMAQARKAITFLGGGVLELFFDGTVPLWTLDISLIIILERAEEFAAKNADKLGAGAGLVQKYAAAKGNPQLARAAGGVQSFTDRAKENQLGENSTNPQNPRGTERMQAMEKQRLSGASQKDTSKGTPSSNKSKPQQENSDETNPIYREEERRKKAREERISNL